MAVSGDSTTFNPTLTALVTQSFRDCNIINDNESPGPEMFEEGRFLLNSIVAGLQGTGIHVWTESEAIVFLQPGQSRYIIGGPVPVNNAPSTDDATWVELGLTTSVAQGATALPFTGSPAGAPFAITTQGGADLVTESGLILTTESAYGVSQGNAVGIVLSNGAMFWTTVGQGVITDTIPLTDPLPLSANANATIVSYPPPIGIVRPLKVPQARLLTFGGPGRMSDIEIPMTVLARQGYEDLPNKRAQGTPTQFYYSPQLGYGLFYVWPTPNFINCAARLTWYRPLNSFFLPNNNMDFPQEWTSPLRWLLSDELKLSYAVPEPRASRIEKKAMEWSTIISGWDRDSEPVQFGMDYRYR